MTFLGDRSTRFRLLALLGVAALALALALPFAAGAEAHDPASEGAPDPEAYPAYFRDRTLTFALSFDEEQDAPLRRQSVFYQVAYPQGWEELGLDAPICNPCDHGGDGVGVTDYHDHVMTRVLPANRHVIDVHPVYTGDPAHDAEVSRAYAAQLPATSADAVTYLLGSRLPDGSAIAEAVDTGYYFVGRVTPRP